MKLFFQRIATFVLTLLLALSIIDIILSKIAETSDYRCIEAWYDLMHKSIDADVIVMGNSRAWVQVDPTVLDSILETNTYNLGMDGSPINRQLHKYNVFRKHNKKPKLIIHNIDYWSLAYEVGYEKEQFFPYFWDNAMRKEFFASEPFSFPEKYIPLYRYHGYNLFSFLKKGAGVLNKGYASYNQSWNGTAFMNVYSIPFALNDTTAVMFDKYLAMTKKESIDIVFVYSPIYSEAAKKMQDLDFMYDTYREFADKYHIPILDYSHMTLSSDTTYFMNAMHLNKLGAEIYSDSLACDIKHMFF